MNILVTGGNGLVGSHFVDGLKKTNHTLYTPSGQELDITNKENMESFFLANKIEVVVHFAAYTDVSKAEAERGDTAGKCWNVNVVGTQNLANMAKNCHFIYISTDMVFSGKEDDKGPYAVDNLPESNPDNVPWYGWTKKCGEDVVKKYGVNWSIIRISNPVRKNFTLKPDYIQKIIQTYDQKGSVTLFNDQYLTLTYIPTLTKSIIKIMNKKLLDTYHISSSDVFTPYELGMYVLFKKYHVANAVKSSSLTEYMNKTGQKSRYPQFGGLKVEQTQKKLGITFPTWKQVVDTII